jgi:hypothetical protein
MKTLERFWQWFDAEKPAPGAALAMAERNLSQVALSELNAAAREISTRAWPTCDFDETAPARISFGHPTALRDLSLALLAARKAMRAAVPEGQRAIVRKQSRDEYEMRQPAAYKGQRFRREYAFDQSVLQFIPETFRREYMGQFEHSADAMAYASQAREMAEALARHNEQLAKLDAKQATGIATLPHPQDWKGCLCAIPLRIGDSAVRAELMFEADIDGKEVVYRVRAQSFLTGVHADELGRGRAPRVLSDDGLRPLRDRP